MRSSGASRSEASRDRLGVGLAVGRQPARPHPVGDVRCERRASAARISRPRSEMRRRTALASLSKRRAPRSWRHCSTAMLMTACGAMSRMTSWAAAHSRMWRQQAAVVGQRALDEIARRRRRARPCGAATVVAIRRARPRSRGSSVGAVAGRELGGERIVERAAAVEHGRDEADGERADGDSRKAAAAARRRCRAIAAPLAGGCARTFADCWRWRSRGVGLARCGPDVPERSISHARSTPWTPAVPGQAGRDRGGASQVDCAAARRRCRSGVAQPAPACRHSCGELLQLGDAVLDVGVGGEQAVEAAPGQRIDDENVGGGRRHLGLRVMASGGRRRGSLQCGGEPQRIAAEWQRRCDRPRTRASG